MGHTLTQFDPYKLKRDYGDDYVTRFFKFEDCEKLKKAPFEGEIVGSFILNKKQYGFIRTTIKHLLKVSKSRKQNTKFSHTPKTQRKNVVETKNNSI